MADDAPRGGFFDYRWLSLGVTTIGSFLSMLSQTTVNIGLPKILTTFNVDIQQGHWVITGYMIALAMVIPISGFLAEKIGIKRLYLITMVMFIVGSGLCSLAWDLNSLIVFRVFQGFGGGMLHPLGLAIVYMIVSPLERARFMAIFGLPALIAPLLGPVAGGYLVDNIGWHAMFTINIPIGLAGLVLAWLLLREQPSRRGARLDLPGFALSSIGFPALLLGFTYGSRDGWGTFPCQLFLTTGVAALVAFTIVELVQPEPMLDLRLFANRIFTLGVVLNFVVQLGLFGTQLLLPLFLQLAQGMSAMDAGMILMPQGLSSFLSMIIGGRLYNRLGPRPLVLFGVGLMMFTTWQLAHVTLATPHSTITWLAMARGWAIGFCFMPVQTAAYNTVANTHMARATALYNGLMRVFASFSTAFLSTVLATRTLFHYNTMAAATTPDRPGVLALMDALQPELVLRGIRETAAQERVVAQVISDYATRQAVTLAFDDVFLLLTAFAGVALVLALFLHDPALEGQPARAAPVARAAAPAG